MCYAQKMYDVASDANSYEVQFTAVEWQILVNFIVNLYKIKTLTIFWCLLRGQKNYEN